LKVLTKISKILKSKSGISLMLVVGTMMLLLAISASVIAAAYANIGHNTRQLETNRIRLLSESIHRNIKFALDNDQGSEASLSYQLIMKLYDAEMTNTIPGDIELQLDINNLAITGEYLPPFPLQINSINLSWNHTDVKITPAIPYIPGIDFGGIPGLVNIPEVARRPQTADINATLTVTVEIEAVRHLGVRSRVITTTAVYEYRDGLLTQEASTSPMYSIIDEADTNYQMGFARPLLPGNQYSENHFGTWSLIAYDTIENIS